MIDERMLMMLARGQTGQRLMVLTKVVWATCYVRRLEKATRVLE